MKTPTYQLTNGDLAEMDAGELREHAQAYIAQHGGGTYVEALVRMIAKMTDINQDDIRDDLVAATLGLS